MSDRKPSSALTTRPQQPAALSADPGATALTVQQVLGQVALIQEIMGATMKDGEHYGRIPGCGDKPTLLKPGAEKLCLTFRLSPTYDIEERELANDHREYRIQCSLTSVLTGAFLGQGVGTCSTKEAKYRYRGNASEVTDQPVPRAYWDAKKEDPARAQQLIGGKGFTAKKTETGWMIAKSTGERTENPDLADQYNTVLKMAKKRALVDAVLTATAASDCFTQDLEDIHASQAAYPAPEPVQAPAPTAKPRRVEQAQEVETTVVTDDIPPEERTYLQTRIHFGKNRGLMLSELTPQQVHWYETDWLPKKELHGGISVEDLTLINALKAYRIEHDAKKKEAPKRDEKPAFVEAPADAPDIEF